MLIDPNHPFFAKQWRRWATTLAPMAWGLAEFSWGNPGWALMFFAAGAYAGYALLIAKSGD